MTDLLELAERVEKATGPDRRLDVLITIATDPDRQWIVGEKPGRWPREPIYGTLSSLWGWATDETKDPPEIGAEPFTASLDAAMTLVPEGLEWRIERRHSKGMHPAYASLWGKGARDIDRHDNAAGKTPALALTAASLRARASGEQTKP